MVGKNVFRKSLVIGIILLFVGASFTPTVSEEDSPTEEEIQTAINDGIEWLVSQQYEDGHWGTSYIAARTAFVLIKLQDYAYETGYSPFDPEYEYSQNVKKGWEYLFDICYTQEINIQIHGDPDTNGNGIGLYWDVARPVYSTGIVEMALAASGTPNRENDAGIDFNSDGNPDTFGEISQDAVDWLAFAQSDSGSQRGGWYYFAENNGSGGDNSITGYAVLGLAAAEEFGSTIPSFVRDELNLFIEYIQCDTPGNDYGGSGYSLPCYWVNMLKTGNLIFEMTFYGDSTSDSRFQDAMDYIENHWHDANLAPGWGYNSGTPAHYQAMYCLMRGLEYSEIDFIDLDGDDTPEHDWYSEFADVLVSHQQVSGSWPTSPAYVWDGGAWGAMSGELLSTVWALLILERIAPEGGGTQPQEMIKPVEGKVICPFHGYIKKGKLHEGIDINGEAEGKNIKAAASGTVVWVDKIDNSPAGKWVWIWHGEVKKLNGNSVLKISTRYLHLKTVAQNIEIGTTITKGTVIGTAGNTGCPYTVSHLHFEVRKGDIPHNKDYRETTALDPLEFINYDNPPHKFFVIASCPIDIIIEDPEGLLINKEINQLPGSAEYIEVKYNVGEDEENLQNYDSVLIENRKIGDYLITVIQEDEACPQDVYNLRFLIGDLILVLADNTQICDIPEQPYIVRSTETEIISIIPATIDIDPDTLNLNSSGTWITCYIELPTGHGYDVEDINISSIILNETVPAEPEPINISDYDEDGIPDLMVKFNRQDVIAILDPGDNVEIKITGELLDGTKFEGIDYIKVI